MYQNGEWYLPQRGVLTPYYVPRKEQLPDAVLRAVGFGFTGATVLTPLASGNVTVQLAVPFLAWALVAFCDVAGGALIQLWHNSQSGQTQLFNKSLNLDTVAGRSGNPMFFPEPHLFAGGDAIRAQAKNLSLTSNANVWMALWGGDVTLPGVK